MLQLKPTEHLTGINLSGDYQDLNALRSAIFRVCGDENEYDGYESARTYLLALCYDLRHAYMGDRGYLSVDNGSDCMGDAIRCIFDFSPDDDIEEMKKRYTNGNLYFHENLVFPDAVYFALVLDEFLFLTEMAARQRVLYRGLTLRLRISHCHSMPKVPGISNHPRCIHRKR